MRRGEQVTEPRLSLGVNRVMSMKRRRVWGLPAGLAFAALAVCLQAQNSQRAVPSPRQAGPLPQLTDITASTGIRFNHLASPDKKYIVESMSGGVALIDYDRDGWLDIYFTNAPDVDMQLAGKKARSALFRNNRDRTFTDVTDKAGVAYPCWANGAVVGDLQQRWLAGPFGDLLRRLGTVPQQRRWLIRRMLLAKPGWRATPCGQWAPPSETTTATVSRTCSSRITPPTIFTTCLPSARW